jgi:uncharacterized protein YhaN
MRIRRLELRAFGPFTDKVLEFAGDGPGLHLVYGPNEAGKSSTLRALKAWLYGFEERTRDNFLHPNDQLLVAGLLEEERQQLYFARRKRRKADLLDAEGHPLDPDLPAAMLHGIDLATFEKLFGLNHDSLIQGATDILLEKGGAGTTLFAAGTGFAALREVLAGLQTDSDEIYKARATKPLLNSELRHFAALKEDVKRLSLSGRQWQEHDQALHQALQELERARLKRSELDGEGRRLERLLQALPVFGARRELRRRLADLQQVRPLPTDFAARRREVEERFTVARQKLAAAEERFKELQEQAAGIQLDAPLLDQAETIGRLHQRLGEFRKGLRDLPLLEGKRVQEKTAAGQLLRKLRPELDLEGRRPCGPCCGAVGASRNWARACPLLQQRADEVDRELRRLERERETLQGALQSLAEPVDVQPLKAALAVAQQLGEVDRDLAERGREAQAERAGLRLAVQRLGLWQGTAEELAALPLPLEESVARFLADRRSGQEEQQERHRRRQELEQDQARLGLEIAAIENAGEVPTERDLERLRRLRDRGWQLLRRQWLDGEEVGAEAGAYHPELPLPEAFEQNLVQADATADRLRREAARVHKYAHLLAQLEATREALASLAAAQPVLEEQAATRERQWQELWQPCGLHPLSPAEMAPWLARMDKLRGQAEQLLLHEQKLAGLAARRETARGELAGALAQRGVPVPAGPGLAPVLGLAQQERDRSEAQARDLQTLQRQWTALTAALPAAAEAVREAGEGLDRARRNWVEALQELGLPLHAAPGDVEDFFESLSACLEHLEKAAEFAQRAAGIQRDNDRLEAEVRLLLEHVVPELAALPVEPAMEQLNGLLERARAQQVVLEGCRESLRKVEAELSRQRGVLAAVRTEVADLCALAGCEAADGLETALRAWQERQTLESRLAEEERRLLQLAGGMSLAEFEGLAGQVDADALPGRVQALGEELEEVNRRISELDQQVGEERTELQRMDGNAAAALKAEEAQTCLARMRRLAERFVRLRIAARVLEEEIERYRTEHQDPVLALAGAYFAELTLHSFAGLRTDVGDKGEPVIVGMRGNGHRVAVEGMSSGTRDQLFLALRLASLEHRLDRHPAIPFIVDDILVNFDDDRTLATLKALTRLAQNNQVILFTHHRQAVQAGTALDCQILEL